MSGEEIARAIEMRNEHAAARGAYDSTCGTCVRVRREAEELAAVLAPLVEQAKREGAAEAWDEGWSQGAHDMKDTIHWGESVCRRSTNPYRAERAAQMPQDEGRGGEG